MGSRDIQTMVDTDLVSIVEVNDIDTRDQIILIREAIHPIRTGAISKVRMEFKCADWSMTLDARK
jgi:hypothetical protein